MDLVRLQILAGLCLEVVMNTERSVALRHRLVKVNLLGSGRRTHKYWLAKRILMSGVDLPEVPGLAVEMDDLLHSAQLGCLPFLVCITGRLW